MAEAYPSNSLKAKEDAEKAKEKTPVTPVVTEKVKVKKKGELRKFASNFIAEDAEHVEGYLFKQVLVPIVKNAIQQLVNKGTDYVLFGESGASKTSTTPQVSYNGYWASSGKPVAPQPQPQQARNAFIFDDIIIPTRDDAERVLMMLNEMIAHFGRATVGDYYDLCDITAPYTANSYGWTDLRDCGIGRSKEGFFLKLPKAVPLEK